MFRTTILLVIVCLALSSNAQKLVTYPSAGVLPVSQDYTVRVRIPGGAWGTVPIYLVHVADASLGTFRTMQSSMGFFDFSGQVEVEITIGKKKFDAVRVRPLSYDIKTRVAGRVLHFVLDRPRNLSIEVDGDVFHNLQLFAGAPEASVPDLADTSTIYFGPGYHRVGTLHVPSGKHIYLSGGAVVEGQFLIDHAENIRISGRGIFYQSGGGDIKYEQGRRDAVKIDFSRNVTVEGIIILPDSYTVLIGQSRDIRLSNIKSFSAGGNHDGIDVFCSRDVLMDNLFMRNSDDCIAVYGHRWMYYGNVTHVAVRNSILWADVAHPILVGTHGDPDHPDTLSDLEFRNIDILDHHERQIDYQGCMSLNAGDSNLIRDVRFEDIRVENFRKGQLVNLRIMYNKKYNSAPGKGIENILFKNVSYNGDRAAVSVIAGYDERRQVSHVRFENLRINGLLITDTMPGKPKWYKTTDMANFFVGEHVEGVSFSLPPFVHPGILHSKAGLDHIYTVARNRTMPEYGSYELLSNHPLASASYKMNGPFAVISRDGPFAYTKSKMEADFSAAYLNALMWVATKDTAHGRKSLEIMERYADSLTTIPATNDAPLLAGLEGIKIVNAMEILRYTQMPIAPGQMRKINRMIRTIFLPVCEKFYDTIPYTNGNWGGIVTRMYMSAAIWFDDRVMYNRAMDFYLNGMDNGTIHNYIDDSTGQIQESGRDQGHSQLGIGALATVCEIAWNQHDDLYGALNNRLLKGFEYVAKYNLGHDDVPFVTWKDITGKYSNWAQISAVGRGRFIPIYEMVHNHYVKRKGLAMPYTEEVIKRIRPEGYDRDQPAFGTLLFYEGGGSGKE